MTGPTSRIVAMKPTSPLSSIAAVPLSAMWYEDMRAFAPDTSNQGLTLVHFSAQPEPFLVTEATADVHFSAQPEAFLSLNYNIKADKKCSRQTESWKRVAHTKRLP